MSYEISSSHLLSFFSKDEAVDYLVSLVKKGDILFPFQKYYCKDPNELFENIKTLNMNVIETSYKLRSYYPKYNTYLPPKFRGVPTIIESYKENYKNADILSDYFIEDVRLQARRYDQNNSILELWNDDNTLRKFMERVLMEDVITPKSLRYIIYKTIPETRVFNPTWACKLLKIVLGNDLKDKKWLDISTGWGDRLLAAMALDMEYIGYDPNIKLIKGHQEMIDMFGNPLKHKVVYEPFEKANIPKGPYDVILTSPPYYIIEEYVPGQQGQSIVNYPEFSKWMVWFLFASLKKAWDNLKIDGYLILHLGDAKTIATTEATNIFIENYLGGSWEGTIGIQGEKGFPRPVWIWKKTITKPNIWKPELPSKSLPYNKRTLYNMYPSLHEELMKYYAELYVPGKYISNINTHNKICNYIRNKISNQYNSIDKKIIDNILKDDNILIFLYENLALDKVILWSTAMVKLALHI
jgi:hypothetical protein